MRTRWISAVALTLMLAAHPAPASADSIPGSWSQQGQDAGWSSYQPRPGGLTLASEGSLARRWSRPGLSGGVPAPSAVAFYGGWLYAAFADGTVRTLNPATGATRRQVLRTLSPADQVVVTGDGIYLRSGAMVTAFDLDGRQRWIFQAPPSEPHVNPFLYAAGRIVVVSGPGGCAESCPAPDRVRVLRADTGAQVWSASAGGHADMQPVVVDGILHQEAHRNGQNPQAIAYRMSTGAVLWRRPRGPMPLAGGGGRLYDGELCAWSSTTGSRRWCRHETSGRFALAPDAVFAYASQTSELVRLTPDGAVSWRFPLGAGAYLVGNPVVGGGVVYAAVLHRDDDGPLQSIEVVALNAATNTVVRRVPLPALSVDALMLAAGHVYVTGLAWHGRGSTVFALGPS